MSISNRDSSNDVIYTPEEIDGNNNGFQSRSNTTGDDIKKVLQYMQNSQGSSSNTDAFIKLIVLVLLALGGGSLYFL